jgi:hypothetical protein
MKEMNKNLEKDLKFLLTKREFEIFFKMFNKEKIKTRTTEYEILRKAKRKIKNCLNISRHYDELKPYLEHQSVKK